MGLELLSARRRAVRGFRKNVETVHARWLARVINQPTANSELLHRPAYGHIWFFADFDGRGEDEVIDGGEDEYRWAIVCERRRIGGRVGNMAIVSTAQQDDILLRRWVLKTPMGEIIETERTLQAERDLRACREWSALPMGWNHGMDEIAPLSIFEDTEVSNLEAWYAKSYREMLGLAAATGYFDAEMHQARHRARTE